MRCLFQWICPLADKINRIRRSVFKQDQWCMPWFRNCPSDTQVQGVPEQSTVPALGSRQCPAPCSQQRCTGGTDSSADWIKLGGSLLGQVQGNKCIHKYLILTILKQKAIFPGLSFLGDSTQTHSMSRYWNTLWDSQQSTRAASFPMQSEEFHC